MISDVLFEAIAEIDRYLNEMPEVYEGETRKKILDVRAHMEEIKRELDTPPLNPEDFGN